MIEAALDRLRSLKVSLTLMHVCGTQQDTLVRFGLAPLLRSAGVTIRQGPGCPVCVTPSSEYAEMIALCDAGLTGLVFGDAARVPTRNGSLLDARARGDDVRIVYGIDDAIRLAGETERECVMMGIGLETTAATTAAAALEGLPENFSILPCYRRTPPAVAAILDSGEIHLDGLIEPGHVSAIVGCKPWVPIAEKHHLPHVVAGFEPLDLLIAVLMIAQQRLEGRGEVENEYRRVVRWEGNERALEDIATVFGVQDAYWRGLATIPESGLALRPEFEALDARYRYAEVIEGAPPPEEETTGCRCGEVLRGLIESQECTLFGRACTPDHPLGPCMVSTEGSCQIAFKYGS